MTPSSSITLITFISPEHFGQVSGSTFPDQVRDRLQSSGSILPNFFWILLRKSPKVWMAMTAPGTAPLTGIMVSKGTRGIGRHFVLLLRLRAMMSIEKKREHKKAHSSAHDAATGWTGVKPRTRGEGLSHRERSLPLRHRRASGRSLSPLQDVSTTH